MPGSEAVISPRFLGKFLVGSNSIALLLALLYTIIGMLQGYRDAGAGSQSSRHLSGAFVWRLLDHQFDDSHQLQPVESQKI